MNDRTMRLSATMVAATVFWLVGNGYKDWNAQLKLSTLVQCYRELGILRGTPRQIWRQLNRHQVPARFVANAVTGVALEVIFACRVSPHWLTSAEKWIDDNRAMLIAQGALDPEAPHGHAIALAAYQVQEKL